jgi:hypothetical protein
MTKEELLKKAYKDYPIGTKYKTTDNVNTYIVGSNDEFIYGHCSGDNIKVGNIKNGFIYCKGKWAEIIKPEPLFIVGKWYKMNNCWYAKFLTIHGSGNFWRYSEQISVNKNYTEGNRNIESWENIPISLLTDLSEIQKYLPDGHPDKTDSLVGRWFKALVDSPYSAGCYKKGDYILMVKENQCSKHMFFYANQINQGKIELMPKGFHPDQLKEDPNKNPNKTPKYVKCIKPIRDNSNPKVGDIIKTLEDGSIYGLCMYNSITYLECFTPSTKEEYDAQFSNHMQVQVDTYRVTGSTNIQHIGNDCVGKRESLVSYEYKFIDLSKKSNELEFQSPIITKSKNSKNKLIIIN